MSSSGKKLFGGVDSSVFWPATIITLAFGILFLIFPERSSEILGNIHRFTLHELGWFFLIATLILLGICVFYAFGPTGNIVLGKKGEKPILKTGTWLGMILTAGTGGSLLYLASIEWIWIIGAPPYGYAPESADAFRAAMAYGMFHWGPSAWAFYIVCAVPIGYFFFAKRRNNMKMSEYARPLIGDKADGLLGHTLNFFYIFGLLGGVMTSVALGTPPMASGISYVLGFGMEAPVWISVLVIALWTFIPLFAFTFGLKKGLAKLSQINIYAFYGLFAVVMLAGPTWFIFNMSTEGMGQMIQNFVSMSLNTDPVSGGGFPQGWTIFYMSWWAVYAMPFGLFIARISKGRTIKQLVIGGLSAGSIGSMLFYMVFPAFGMSQQLAGTTDLVQTMATYDRGGVAVDMFRHFEIFGMNIGIFMVIAFTLIVLLSFITGHVSVGYALAAASEKEMTQDADPQKWNVGFWLLLAGFVSLSLFLINPGALAPLQTVSIISGFPIVFCIFILVFAFFKQIGKDFPNGIPTKKHSKDLIYIDADENQA